MTLHEMPTTNLVAAYRDTVAAVGEFGASSMILKREINRRDALASANFDFVGLRSCADSFGVKPSWLKQAANDGLVPCMRIGKSGVYFSLSAVEKCLSA